MIREAVAIHLAGAVTALSVGCAGEVTWTNAAGATSSAGGSTASGGGGAAGSVGGYSAGGGGATTLTSTGTTSTTTGTGACDEGHDGDPTSYHCAECEDCAAAGPCASDVEACVSSTDCLDYSACRQQGCGDCPECDALHPAGMVSYDALMQCLYCTCESDCGVAELCAEG